MCRVNRFRVIIDFLRDGSVYSVLCKTIIDFLRDSSTYPVSSAKHFDSVVGKGTFLKRFT